MQETYKEEETVIVTTTVFAYCYISPACDLHSIDFILRSD